jgi:hypothetical protein
MVLEIIGAGWIIFTDMESDSRFVKENRKKLKLSPQTGIILKK